MPPAASDEGGWRGGRVETEALLQHMLGLRTGPASPRLGPGPEVSAARRSLSVWKSVFQRDEVFYVRAGFPGS